MKNPLLQYRLEKHAGTMSVSDLDAYDSEVVRELLEIHDQILYNPAREFDAMNPASMKRYFEVTMRGLRDRLYPAIRRGAKELKRKYRDQVISLMKDAQEFLHEAETLGIKEEYKAAVGPLEDAFSYLHDALEIMQVATRKRPEVRHIPIPGKVR